MHYMALHESEILERPCIVRLNDLFVSHKVNLEGDCFHYQYKQPEGSFNKYEEVFT